MEYLCAVLLSRLGSSICFFPPLVITLHLLLLNMNERLHEFQKDCMPCLELYAFHVYRAGYVTGFIAKQLSGQKIYSVIHPLG